jgi:hypothetical protein
MAQDDKDPPETPFGGKTFNEAMEEPPPIETVVDPAEQAQAEREWRLIEAEEQSKKLSPTFVNRAFVKMEGRVMRITFGERVADEDVYRSAIVMTPEDAYELGQLLMAQSAPAYGALIEHYRHIWEGLENNEGPVDASNSK